MKIAVIIAAGGEGKRMGHRKQFLPLLNSSVVETTLAVFRKVKGLSEIVLVVSPEDVGLAKNIPGVKVVEGGKERQDSVANGLKAVSPDTDLVLIHDGARPLITIDVIDKAISEAVKYGAAVVGVPAKDTVKVVGDDLLVESTPERKKLWLIQTPQVFKYSIITQAHKQAKSKLTDDAGLVEAMGGKVKMVMGTYENLKITTPEDVLIAETILKRRGS
jgi:2-C-methyl-D-erythritol 4-phosphate cytidylyltransferase